MAAGVSMAASDFAQRLVGEALWPPQRRLFIPRLRLPARNIHQQNPRAVRHHYSPKLRRAVACESGLEQRFFDCLDGAPSVVSYCEQPLWIPYRYRGQYPHYHPDVLVVLDNGRQILVEVKSAADLADFKELRKWRALLRFAHVPGYGVYIGDNASSLGSTAQREVDAGLLEALQIFAGSRGGVSQVHMQILRRRFSFDDADLAAAVLQCGLFMTRRPFAIRTPSIEEAAVLGEVRAALAAYVTDPREVFPQATTVPAISRAALGVEPIGGPPWFHEPGWSYEAATRARCPACGDDLHALRSPWIAPDNRQVRTWAIVCVRCANARTIGSLPDDVQRAIRAA